MIAKIQTRRDIESNWYKFDPVPSEGEECITLGTTPTKRKIGDGVRKWSQLPYEVAGSGGGSLADDAPSDGSIYGRQDGKWAKINSEALDSAIIVNLPGEPDVASAEVETAFNDIQSAFKLNQAVFMKINTIELVPVQTCTSNLITGWTFQYSSTGDHLVSLRLEVLPTKYSWVKKEIRVNDSVIIIDISDEKYSQHFSEVLAAQDEGKAVILVNENNYIPVVYISNTLAYGYTQVFNQETVDGETKIVSVTIRKWTLSNEGLKTEKFTTSSSGGSTSKALYWAYSDANINELPENPDNNSSIWYEPPQRASSNWAALKEEGGDWTIWRLKPKDGTDGTDGTGVKSSKTYYWLSDQGITPSQNESDWLESMPDLVTGKYLWIKTVYQYTDGTNNTVYSLTYIPYAESAVYVDLDNEIDCIALDYDGKVAFDQTVESNIALWFGTNQLTIDQLSIDGVPEGVSSVLNKETGKILINFSKGHVFGDSDLQLRIPITGSYNEESYSKQVVLKIRGIKAGSPGEDAILYKLEPSVNVIKKFKDGSLSVDYITCNRVKVVGSTKSIITDGKLVCLLDGGNTEIEIFNDSIISTTFTRQIEFRFYLNSILWDKETILIVEDGTDGKDGKDGKDGTSVSIEGTLISIDELPTEGVIKGMGYIIDGDLWVYTGTSLEDDKNHNGFTNMGPIKGQDGDSIFKSIVFKRFVSNPDTPTGGSYDSPVPTGWSDGVPAGDLQLWMSTRVFTKSGNAPQQSEWTTPQPATDTETLDFEYSSVKENPGNPTSNPRNWHDASISTVDDIWMAMRTIENGTPASSWSIFKIKGEDGERGCIHFAWANSLSPDWKDFTYQKPAGMKFKYMGIYVHYAKVNMGDIADSDIAKEDYTWTEIGGADGKSAIYADLDEEMIAVAVDSDGNATHQQSWTTTFSMWEGSTKQTLTSLAINAPSPISATVDKSTGKIVIQVASGANLSPRYEVTITGKSIIDGEDIIKIATLVIICPRPGAPGEKSTLYQLQPSVSSVVRRDDNTYSDTVVSCKVIKIVGSEVSVVELSSSVKIYYYLDDSLIKRTYTDPIPVGSNGFSSKVKFDLEVDEFLWDTEIIPVLKDGINGSSLTVVNTKYYYAQTASYTTIPSDWSENTLSPLPGMYLWTRTVFTWSDGSETGMVSYQRVVSGNAPFTSYVFARTNQDLSKSVLKGGTYRDPIPENLSFETQGLDSTGDKNIEIVKWSDGVMSGEDKLWMSSRIFTVDGEAPQEDSWSTPVVVKTTSSLQYKFSSAINKPQSPEVAGTGVWYDNPTFESIWMAYNLIEGGVSKGWVIVQIKGEKGVTGDSGVNVITQFKNVWLPSGKYTGTKHQQDIVYYQAPGESNGKYYIANPTRNYVESVTPAPGTVAGREYWNEFEGQYANIATGFLFTEKAVIENAVIRALQTSEVGRRLETVGNELISYDNNGLQRLVLSPEEDLSVLDSDTDQSGSELIVLSYDDNSTPFGGKVYTATIDPQQYTAELFQMQECGEVWETKILDEKIGYALLGKYTEISSSGADIDRFEFEPRPCILTGFNKTYKKYLSAVDWTVESADKLYIISVPTISHSDAPKMNTRFEIVARRIFKGLSSSNIVIEYAVSSYEDVIPADDKWVKDIPTNVVDKYIWKRTTTTFSNGAITTDYSVIYSSIAGTQIDIKNILKSTDNLPNSGNKVGDAYLIYKNESDTVDSAKDLYVYVGNITEDSTFIKGFVYCDDYTPVLNDDGSISYYPKETDETTGDVHEVMSYLHIGWCIKTDNSDKSFFISNYRWKNCKNIGVYVDTDPNGDGDLSLYNWHAIADAQYVCMIGCTNQMQSVLVDTSNKTTKATTVSGSVRMWYGPETLTIDSLQVKNLPEGMTYSSSYGNGSLRITIPSGFDFVEDSYTVDVLARASYKGSVYLKKASLVIKRVKSSITGGATYSLSLSSFRITQDANGYDFETISATAQKTVTSTSKTTDGKIVYLLDNTNKEIDYTGPVSVYSFLEKITFRYYVDSVLYDEQTAYIQNNTLEDSEITEQRFEEVILSEGRVNSLQYFEEATDAVVVNLPQFETGTDNRESFSIKELIAGIYEFYLRVYIEPVEPPTTINVNDEYGSTVYIRFVYAPDFSDGDEVPALMRPYPVFFEQLKLGKGVYVTNNLLLFLQSRTRYFQVRRYENEYEQFSIEARVDDNILRITSDESLDDRFFIETNNTAKVSSRFLRKPNVLVLPKGVITKYTAGEILKTLYNLKDLTPVFLESEFGLIPLKSVSATQAVAYACAFAFDADTDATRVVQFIINESGLTAKQKDLEVSLSSSFVHYYDYATLTSTSYNEILALVKAGRTVYIMGTYSDQDWSTVTFQARVCCWGRMTSSDGVIPANSYYLLAQDFIGYPNSNYNTKDYTIKIYLTSTGLRSLRVNSI